MSELNNPPQNPPSYATTGNVPTPRTESFIDKQLTEWPLWDWQDHASAYADFARTLERELAEAKAELAKLYVVANEESRAKAQANRELEANRTAMLDLVNKTGEQFAATQSELAALRRDRERLLELLIHADKILDDIYTCSDAYRPMYSSYFKNVAELCIKGREARRAAIDAAIAQEDRT